MTKSKNENARHSVDRIARLKRRMNTIRGMKYVKPSHIAELSSLEWALPILEEHVRTTYGELPATRYPFFKHEQREIVEFLEKRDGLDCYLCYLFMPKDDRTVDHVIPLAKGGLDFVTNYGLTHNACNIDKGNLLLEDYRKVQEQRIRSQMKVVK